MEPITAYLRTLKRIAKKYDVQCEIIDEFYLELLGGDSSENCFFIVWGKYEDRTNMIINKLPEDLETVQLRKMLNTLPNITRENKNELCICGEEMTMDREELQMRCSCGREVSMPISVNDAQFYGQEGQSAKPGIFNPSKHYRNWMKLILGQSVVIPDDVINSCKSAHTIQDVRITLNDIGRIDLNKYASAVWSRVTGNSIPKVSDDVLVKGEYLFIQVLEARKHIKELCNKNRRYYPYYIFKILDLLCKGEDRSILRFIHMQGSDTVEKNDDEWRLICKKVPLEWRSTCSTLRNEFGPC